MPSQLALGGVFMFNPEQISRSEMTENKEWME